MTLDLDIHDDLPAPESDELTPEARHALDAGLDILLAAEHVLDNADDEAEFREAAFALRAAESDATALWA